VIVFFQLAINILAEGMKLICAPRGGYFNHLESIFYHNDKTVQAGTPMTVHLEGALMY